MRSLLDGVGRLVREVTAARDASSGSTSVGAPVPYVGGLTGRLANNSGAADHTSGIRAYGQNSTLFPIVNRLAYSVGSTEWKLYRKAKSGRSEDRVEVTSHPALDMWNMPNGFMTGSELRESTQQHIDLVGEGVWVVERSPSLRSIPLGLWPVRPDRIEPVPSAKSFLAGWVYTGPDGERVPLPLDCVIQTKMPAPGDPYRGMGPVQAALIDVDSARYSAEWNRNFFINGAQAAGIIEVPDSLDDTEFDAFTMRWREQHQGVSNAHRVALLENGMKWVDTNFSQKDMQFTELRQLSRDFLREAYGYPKSMLGATDDVNRANAEAGEYVFSKWLIDPRNDRLKSTANHRYLPLWGTSTQGLEFDYVSRVPEDKALENATLLAKAQAAASLVAAGYDRGDVLSAVDLPEMAYLAVAPAPAVPPADGAAADMLAALRTVLNAQRRESIDARPSLPPARPPTGPALDAVPGNPQTVGQPAGGAPMTLPADEMPDVSAARDLVDAALAALLVRWAALAIEQKASLVRQVLALAQDGRLSELPAVLHVDTGDAVSALLAAMEGIVGPAGRHVVDEAGQQSVDIGAVRPSQAELDAVATVTATLLADELRVSASRAALLASGPEADADAVAAAVRAALDGLSQASAAKQLGGALHGTLNATRIATLKAAPVGALYAQEMNDRNTCGPCREVDGRWLGNTDDLAQVEASYPAGAFGGYVFCLGGANCRGTVVGVWRPKTVGDGE